MIQVLLIDPSSRGGIATYSKLLARALQAAGAEPSHLGSSALEDPATLDVPMFRRLPDDRWGKPQPRQPFFYAKQMQYWLHAAVVVAVYVRRRRPDVVHFLAPINRRLDALLIRRLARRASVVWTAHNVLPHEGTDRDRDWFGDIYRAADRVVVHSQPAAEAIRALAAVDAVVIPHPVPEDVLRVPRSEARNRLALPVQGRIVAALGFIRAYKGYGLLADVWERLGKNAPTILVMGELIAEDEQQVLHRLEQTGRAVLRIGYASDSDLQLAIAASDAILLPHERADSGLLHLARAVGVPVIASDAPQLAAAVRSSSAGVVVPRTVEAWSSAVTGKLPPPPPTAPPLRDIGMRHRALYENALDSRFSTMRSFRLVVYTDSDGLGGAERMLADLVEALDPRIEIVVMGTHEHVVSWIAQRRGQAGTCLVPAVRDKRDLAPIFEHWRALKALRPAIFQANLCHPWSCQYGIAAALLTRGTKVIAVEHALNPPHPFQRRLKRVTSVRLAAHIAVGSRTARDLERLIGLREHSIRTIHNGVHPTPGARIRRPFSQPTVAAIARFSEEKGLDLLLRALADVPDACAVIIGDGPGLKPLEHLRDELGLRDKVRLTGWVDEPREWLGAVDALAVPSYREAFPLVVLEAMHAALPVVASDVGSIREAVIPGVTGLVVPPGDAAAFAEALRTALDPGTAARMGAAGRTAALDSFTVERVCQDYERLYRMVLG
jgi:glycosyltransferase involved in cell wall biosynthesis